MLDSLANSKLQWHAAWICMQGWSKYPNDHSNDHAREMTS